MTEPSVEMPLFSRFVLASCLVGSALGFEQLAGFKMPSLQGLQKAAQNKAKFGDKKLAIVTGTSSGSCRHHLACTAYAWPPIRSSSSAVLPPTRPRVQISGVNVNLTNFCKQVLDARRSSTSCAPANTMSLAPFAISKRSVPSPPKSASTPGFQTAGSEAVSAVSSRAYRGVFVLHWQMEAVAEMDELDMENFTPMYCDLNGTNSQKYSVWFPDLVNVDGH